MTNLLTAEAKVLSNALIFFAAIAFAITFFSKTYQCICHISGQKFCDNF